MKQRSQLISIVVPCYNEGLNIRSFYQAITKVLKGQTFDYELVYVNDGSRDDTLQELHKLAARDKHVRVLGLSKNFGKEIATTAGIHHARGDAIIMIDADGQHPVELIPQLVAKWQAGAHIVTGVRNLYKKESRLKQFGSQMFYAILHRLTGTQAVAGATDYRLIDRDVQREFIRITERNRITRGLIDWIGFTPTYVYYDEKPRLNGVASQSYSKLFGLALNSFISLSLKPLYFAFYTGLVVLPLSILLALASALEMAIGDPMHLHITGTAYLVMLALFLISIVLMSQGITALYLSHIHTETQNRPLFIIDATASRRAAVK